MINGVRFPLSDESVRDLISDTPQSRLSKLKRQVVHRRDFVARNNDTYSSFLIGETNSAIMVKYRPGVPKLDWMVIRRHTFYDTPSLGPGAIEILKDGTVIHL